MMGLLPRTRVLICQLCHSSQHLATREVPETCPVCKEPAHWRIADPGELTKFDRRFLAGLLIASD